MAIYKSKPVRFQMSYKQREAPTFIAMEEELMEEMCIGTRSDLHKKAVKHLHQSYHAQKISLI